MSWMGKILGGGIGFMFGGPIGAILGAVVGHHALDRDGGSLFDLSAVEARQSIYFVATFSMLAKLAKADGVVTQHEIDVIEQVMRNNLRLTPPARQFAIDVFNEAKDSDTTFEDFARQFYDEFRDSPEILESLIELLLFVANADNQLHGAEEQLIQSAVRMFGLEDRYSQLKSRFYGSPDDIGKYYAILGCSPGDDPATVKGKYRKLAMEHHPDRMEAKGMSPELRAAAEEKFKEIQHAWDVVEKDLQGR